MNEIRFADGHRLRQRRHGERGQVLPFLVLVALLTAVFILVMLNLDELTNTRQRAQSAADITTIAGAEWMARGMNLVSLLNILLTLLMTQIGIMSAFTQTVQQATMIAMAGVMANCPFGPACQQFCQELSELTVLSQRLEEKQPEQHLLDSMRQIHRLEVDIASGQGVVPGIRSIPGLAASDVQTLGEMLEVDQSGFYSLLGTSATARRLPVKPGVRGDLCEPAEHGRLGGYDKGRGAGLIEAYSNLPLSKTLEQIRTQATAFNEGPNGPFHNPLLWAPYFEVLLAKAPRSSLGGALLLANIEQAWRKVCSSQDEDTGPLLLEDDLSRLGAYVGWVHRESRTIRTRWWPERLENTTGAAQGMNILAQAGLYNPFSTDTGPGMNGDTFTPQWRARLMPVDPQAVKTVEALASSTSGFVQLNLGAGELYGLH